MRFVIILAVCISLSIITYADNIRVATSDWPPFYSPKLDNNGILTYIVQETLKPIGHTLTVDFLPWARALALTKAGKYHALLGCWHTKEREDYYYFTKKILDAGPHFMKKESSKLRINKPKDLEGSKIGIIRDFALSDTIKKLITEDKIHLVEVDSVYQLFELIEFSRVDVILENPLVLKYQYKNKFTRAKHELVSAGPDFKDGYIYVCWSKKMSGIKKIIEGFDISFDKIFTEAKLTKTINDLFN
ncbi:substrate-binding periplasmic protein [Spartinivicinus ruber]|uniref:substrate-binding periplasmic protein n=1 Tax=Spartinivicinus ruber TaxID=2683272 RepID=UPI0013D1AFD5|nr:transporter substrate-binding domain-containing protein [Spartinivicinus ruber]